MKTHREVARRSFVAIASIAACWLSSAAPAPAQQTATGPAATRSAGRDTLVTPGPHYRAGWLRRIFLGGNYRDLWTTPIAVEVLPLDALGGGLTPIARGGGKQTASLRFRGGDGRQYTFRTLEKDPTPALPVELRETIANRFAKDYTSAIHPSGPLVVAPLVRAAGVLQAEPRLVVLADDPRLGEFRAEFAGRLGWIEERADENEAAAARFAGASDVVSTETLFERIERSPNDRVDARAFLAARLVDLFLGDWDRHQDQWRWAKLGEGTNARWVPVARDRDYAFARFEGLLVRLARASHPQFVSFGERYPNMLGLTWQAREVDRRLLVELERATWDSVAQALRRGLTDDVIAGAVQQLPPEHRSLNAAWLASALRQRRDELPAAAGRFYTLLAGEVDVHLTDEPEVVEVRALGENDVEVSVYRRDGVEAPRATAARAAPAPDTSGGVTASTAAGVLAGGPAPHFRRRFSGRETREVRLFMHGGDDRVIIGAGGAGGPKIRVIGGGGDDEVVDSSARAARVYDDRGDNRLVSRAGRSIDRKAYQPPVGRKGPHDVPRDWGSSWHLAPWVSFSPDLGFLLGGGPVITRYGFRKHPHAMRLRLRAGYATEAQDYRAEALGELRRENSDVYSTVRALASGVEILRFHGFGNETELAGSRDFYRVDQEQWLLEPAVVFPLAPRVGLTLGPTVKYADTDTVSGRFISAARPYGVGSFGQAGARAHAVLDTRDRPSGASRGVVLSLEGSYYPEVWSVESQFGATRAEAATYLTAPIIARPTLALRAGGRKVWGTYPFYEASFIGGDSTVRGFRQQRFAGDASVYGNAELRLFLGRVTLILPADVGVFGLADAGRVYLSGESSDEWHTATGGGIWLAPLSRANVFTLAVARSTERTGIYFRSGFLF